MKSRFAVVAALCVMSCGLPASFSQPVEITPPTLSSKNNAAGGTASTSKDVSTAGGNPYGAFISAAQQHLGGANPSRITVTSLSLKLLSTSTGVTGLDQVFSGNVVVSFVMNGSNASSAVGSINNPSGAGPVTLTTTFDSSSMQSADYSRLVQGQFKVLLSGTSASGFNNAVTETADTDLTFGFVAYR